MMEKIGKFKSFLQLHVLLCFLSLGAIFSKLAANEGTFNSKFIFFYALQLLILFIYAVLWQQIIKKMPLSTAYANRAITVFWGMIWGWLLFSESIKFNHIIGCFLILMGIVCFVKGNLNES